MKAFPETLTGIAAPLVLDNIDTDAIIPSREMRSTGRTGLADGLFAPWRYTNADTRIENPDFALNKPQFRGTQILAGGANFGCGSSREHAVWALAEYGVRAIIAKSFAPIFRANCIRNFLLPIELSPDIVEAVSGREITIQLPQELVRCGDEKWSFEIDAESKEMLLGGLDAIDLTLTQSAEIDTWTKHDRAARPWIYLEQAS